MELLILGGLAATGYMLSKQKSIEERTQVLQNDYSKVPTEAEVVGKRYQQAKKPYQTGVYANPHIVADPLPMFSSRRLNQNSQALKQPRLELFTGVSAEGGMGLRVNKQEQSPLFKPEENMVAVSSGGTGGNPYAALDTSRYVPSMTHQNVTCVPQVRDVNALRQDPLHRALPYAPHAKPAEMQYPSPTLGAAAVPSVYANTLDRTDNRMRIKKVDPDENKHVIPGRAAYDYRQPGETHFYERATRKIQPGSYFGGPHHYTADGYENNRDTQASRTRDRSNEVEYYGSGVRVLGGQDTFHPAHQDRRDTLDPLHPTAAVGHFVRASIPREGYTSGVENLNREPEKRLPFLTGSSAIPSTHTQASAVAEYQQRPKANYDVEYEGPPGANRPLQLPPSSERLAENGRRQAVALEEIGLIPGNTWDAHYIPFGDITRPKINSEQLLPDNEHGHMFPTAPPDDTYIRKAAECRDKVIVSDAPVLPNRIQNKELNVSQVCVKRPEIVTDEVRYGDFSKVTSTDGQTAVVTRDPKHPCINPHPPILHANLD